MIPGNPMLVVFPKRLVLQFQFAWWLVHNILRYKRTSVRTELGMSYYYLTYEIPQLNSGFYVLIVTAGKERRQVTIVVEK